MAQHLGRLASVKIGSDVVAEQVTWSLTKTGEVAGGPVFGTEWNRNAGIALKSWTASFNGMFDHSDTTGQNVLEDAHLNDTLLDTIRFYVDSTSYYTPDVTNDSDAGCRVTSVEISYDRGDVGQVTFTVEGTGPIVMV